MAEEFDERTFEKVADQSLKDLSRALDEAATDFEADLQNGILTIEFPDGVKYVINSHRAAKQIWMAAERNAWHFDYRGADGKWIGTKNADELWATVEGVIARKLNAPFSLKRPTFAR